MKSLFPTFQKSDAWNARWLAIVLIALVGQSKPSNSAELNEWQNPKLTGVNNLPPHATMVICPDSKTAQGIALVNNR